MMQRHETVKLYKEDLAKYPFIVQAREYVRKLNIDLQNLQNRVPEAISRVRKLIENAIIKGECDIDIDNVDAEIIAYPLARLLIEIINDRWLKQRFAVAFSKRVWNLLRRESNEKIMLIATQPGNICENGWNLQREEHITDNKAYEWKLHFKDYIRASRSLKAPTWKLTNRLVSNGYVRLTKKELVRLIAECVKERLISSEVPRVDLQEIPEWLKELIEEIRDLMNRYKKEVIREDLADMRFKVTEEAFPPCVIRIIEAASRGENLSHEERLFLLFFMLNIGKDVEEIIDYYRKLPDFNEEKTRYYILHAKAKGYTAHNCDTLRSLGICTPNHEWCVSGNIKNPLVFYRRMQYVIRRRKTENK
ncbi:MAG: hypothetical protein ACTSXX_08750 [Candidatus Baldrarchaeia archaeon]